MESYVRGATMDEIVKVNSKVNRALAASAAALGANVRLQDTPGYWPRRNPEEGCRLVIEAMGHVVENPSYHPLAIGGGCSDMGDVGAVMPALHPYIGGAVGATHGTDYYIADPELACVKSAQVQLIMLALLLRDGAKGAKHIIEAYKPEFSSMEEYFAYVDKLTLDQRAVTYEVDGKVTLNFGG